MDTSGIKHTITFEIKMPIPGVAYSNMATSISVEGVGNYQDLKTHAIKCLGEQTQTLIDEIKEAELDA